MTAEPRVAQHGAVTLDVELPSGRLIRPHAELPAALFAAALLLLGNAACAVFDLPYRSPVQVAAVILAVLAVLLTPLLVHGHNWARTAVTTLLGLHVAATVFDVLRTPDPHHALLALRATVWVAVTVILLFRERANAYFTRQRAERTIRRLPRG